MKATLRRPRAEILGEIMGTPLGVQMASKYGWTEAQFASCLDYAIALKAAIRADRREDGPRQRRATEQFRRSFGARDSDLAMLEYTDRSWQREGFAAQRDANPQVKSAEFVAMILVNQVAD